jgi:hypothetical protein
LVSGETEWLIQADGPSKALRDEVFDGLQRVRLRISYESMYGEEQPELNEPLARNAASEPRDVGV